MKKLAIIMSVVLVAFMAFQSNAQKKEAKTACFKSNMHCAACGNTLFEHLRFEKGVKELEIDHVSNTLKVVYDEKKTSEGSLAKSIEKKGYKAESITGEEYAKLTAANKKPASPAPDKH